MNRLLQRPLRFAIFFALSLIVLCFVWVFLLTKPAFIPGFNLQGKYQIGETIGGITAPLVGIGSSVLLFLALMSQMRATQMQREAFTGQDMKNESDFIFSMFNQFLTELSNFSYNYDERYPPGQVINIDLTGLTALNKFVNKYCTTTLKNLGIGNFAQSRQIILLIDSLNNIRQRIASAQISEVNRKMYSEKLNSYYDNYLRENLDSLVRTFEANVASIDGISNKIASRHGTWAK